MQLPDDILFIVREYSKPLTRPDWRTLQPCKLIYTELYTEPFYRENQWNNLYTPVFDHLQNSEWGKIYAYVKKWGIWQASFHFELPKEELHVMQGMFYANAFYIRVNSGYTRFDTKKALIFPM